MRSIVEMFDEILCCTQREKDQRYRQRSSQTTGGSHHRQWSVVTLTRQERWSKRLHKGLRYVEGQRTNCGTQTPPKKIVIVRHRSINEDIVKGKRRNVWWGVESSDSVIGEQIECIKQPKDPSKRPREYPGTSRPPTRSLTHQIPPEYPVRQPTLLFPLSRYVNSTRRSSKK